VASKARFLEYSSSSAAAADGSASTTRLALGIREILACSFARGCRTIPPMTQVLAGTSGFSYKEWLGKFYPEKHPADQMLRYYAGQFATVEINNTFYRMPAEAMLARWAEEVPEGFSFTLKAPRRITHELRLKDCETHVAEFLRRAQALGGKLGPVLFQLPPYLKKDLARLRDFLALLPAE